MSGRTYWLVLTGIIALGVVLRLFYFDVTIGSDDQRYIIAARKFVGADPSPMSDAYLMRIGWRAILAAGTSALGEISLDRAAYFLFFLSTLSAVLLALLTRTLFGDVASWIAVALHATLPVNMLFDVVCLSDSLAVPLLLGSACCFARFLGSGRSGPLLGALAIAALLPSVKETFAIIFGVYGLCVLLRPDRLGTRCLRAVLVVVSAGLGIGLYLGLHFWESGNPWRGFGAIGNYCAMSPSSEAFNLANALRCNYLRWLCYDFCGTGGYGWLYLPGLLFLLACAWRDAGARFVGFAAGAYLLFLSAMPTSWHPLRFVEQQPRYLMVVEPFLAAGVGAAFGWFLRTCPWRLPRLAAVALLAYVCALNAASANPVAPYLYGRPTAATGPRASLALLRARGDTRLVMPSHWDDVIPDGFRRQEIEVCFAPPSAPVLAAQDGHEDMGDLAALLPGPGTGFYLPAGIETLPSHRAAVKQLEQAGYHGLVLSCPCSALGVWLETCGVRPQGCLVRWLERHHCLTMNQRNVVGHLWVHDPPTRP
jgi:hypothetical protein